MINNGPEHPPSVETSSNSLLLSYFHDLFKIIPNSQLVSLQEKVAEDARALILSHPKGTFDFNAQLQFGPFKGWSMLKVVSCMHAYGASNQLLLDPMLAVAKFKATDFTSSSNGVKFPFSTPLWFAFRGGVENHTALLDYIFFNEESGLIFDIDDDLPFLELPGTNLLWWTCRLALRGKVQYIEALTHLVPIHQWNHLAHPTAGDSQHVTVLYMLISLALMGYGKYLREKLETVTFENIDINRIVAVDNLPAQSLLQMACLLACQNQYQLLEKILTEIPYGQINFDGLTPEIMTQMKKSGCYERFLFYKEIACVKNDTTKLDIPALFQRAHTVCLEGHQAAYFSLGCFLRTLGYDDLAQNAMATYYQFTQAIIDHFDMSLPENIDLTKCSTNFEAELFSYAPPVVAFTPSYASHLEDVNEQPQQVTYTDMYDMDFKCN